MATITTMLPTAEMPDILTPPLKYASKVFDSGSVAGVSLSRFGRRSFPWSIRSCLWDPSSSSNVAAVFESRKLVAEFDPEIPVERAVTPPSSWYTDPYFYRLERDRVFYGGWQVVGHSEQIKDLRDFFTGRLGDVEFLVCRDDNGKINAFHNVCSHHATILASGSGKKPCFVCPYHGWTYSLTGALVKATRITGIENFDSHVWHDEFGLKPLSVAVWGPFVLLKVSPDASSREEAEIDDITSKEWLGSSAATLNHGGVDASLSYICRREYTIKCNWKVFCDNYLDGGYHVPYAHKGLASSLDLNSYSTKIFERVSIQECGGGSKASEDAFNRLGSKALYAFIYPNFMINRYGPWMDTNLVIPLGPRKCKVVFDYFLEPSLKEDESFIERSLEESERVQMEDIELCESVQRGLESPAYVKGRYVPSVEKAMHHFHCLLHQNLKQ